MINVKKKSIFESVEYRNIILIGILISIYTNFALGFEGQGQELELWKWASH